MRYATTIAVLIILAVAGFAQSPSQSTSVELAARLQAADVHFQKEDWPAAVREYEAILKDAPNHRLAHFRVGYALHMLKRLDDALPHHLEATQINNQALRIDALYNVACANALLGRKNEALRFLQHAIDTGFGDVEQIRKDSDLDSLRNDAEFQRITATIGTAYTLPRQLDFLVGTWSRQNPIATADQPAPRYVFTRPAASSHAISSVATNGTMERVGLLTPNFADRSWRWVLADGMGTTSGLTGRLIDASTLRFEGRDTFAAGDGPIIRVTITRESDKRIRVRTEFADKPDKWTSVSDEVYERQ